MNPKVLLFGAGGALGAAIASHLSGEGFSIYTAGTTHWDGAIAHLALGYDDRCDAATFSSLPDLEAVVWAQGVNCSDTVESFTPDDLERLLQGNVMFVASSLQALLTAKKLSAGSRLAVVSSIWQLESRPGKFSYSVSKAALQGLVKSAALDLGPDGILINAVLPGMFDTDRIKSNFARAAAQQSVSEDQIKTQRMNSIPAKRLGTAEEFGRIAAFLSSAHAGYITGQNLLVDGGAFRSAF